MLNSVLVVVAFLCFACAQSCNEYYGFSSSPTPSWVTSAVLGGSIQGGEAVWFVPPLPPNVGQTLYIFLSYQNNGHSIQAALIFNSWTGWTVAGCYGLQTQEQTINCSSGVSVNPGDQIKGVIQFQLPNYYSVNSTVSVNGVEVTSLTHNYADFDLGLDSQLMLGIQIYNYGSCAAFPPSNAINFGEIAPYYAGNPTPTLWKSQVSFGACSFSSYGVDESVQFRWQAVGPTSGPYQNPGYYGADFNGGDLAYGYASSALECAQQCDYYTDCQSWSYTAGGCNSNSNDCFLKAAVGFGPIVAPDSCVESNYKVGDLNSDRGGAPYNSFQMTPHATPATCATACDFDSNCSAWVMQDNWCYLKLVVGPKVYSANAISGVKAIDSNINVVQQAYSSYPRPFLWIASEGLSPNHRWVLLDAPDGSFLLQSFFLDNMCLNGDTLAPNPNNTNNPSNWHSPYMATCDVNNANQYWSFVPAATGGRFTFKIENQNNGMCLDSDVTAISQYDSTYPAPFLSTCNESPTSNNHIWYVSATYFIAW